MIPSKELMNRIKNLQQALQQKEINLAILVQRADLFYFSGTGQDAHLLVPADGEPILVVKRSLSRATQESALEKIVPFKGWGDLKNLIAGLAPQSAKIGLELDVIPVNTFNRYLKLIDGYEPVDLSASIRLIRSIKSAYEIAQMKQAATISKEIFTHAAEIIREGLSEVDLSAALEHKARTLGHQGAVRMRGFNQELYYGHIMSGDNAASVSFFDGPTGGSGLNPSYPQGAGRHKIKKHEPVLVDFVSIYEGYMVDQTRIFSIGHLKPHLEKAYEESVKIKNRLAGEGKPGVSGSSLFLLAENLAAQAGLANHFMGYTEKVSFVGHGVGLELDEMPVIARGLDFNLAEGMVFALEPKFIFPGEGTVGIEDTFVVGCSRLEQLTLLDDKLIII